MAQNLIFDPVARDYVFLNGSPQPSSRILEQCYYALAIPQNNWLYGIQGQGSLLYTLIAKKRTSSVEQIFISIARNALNAQVVQTNEASAIGLVNIATSRTGTSNEIEAVQATQQAASQLSFVPV